MIPFCDIKRQYLSIKDELDKHLLNVLGSGMDILGDQVKQFENSFANYCGKKFGAFGDGGMIVTDDIELYEKLILMRNYGQKQRYYQVVEGINSRLDEIQAAILNLKLKYLDKWNSRRSEIAKMYFEGLKDNKDVVLPLDAENSDQVFHLFVIRHRDKEGLMNYLTSKGVQTLIHYPIPNHLQEYYLKNFDRRFNLPKTEEYSKEILSLPMFPELTDEEVAEIIRFINAYSSLK